MGGRDDELGLDVEHEAPPDPRKYGPDDEETKEYEEALTRVEAVCDASGIEHKRSEGLDFEWGLEISLPDGGSKRSFIILDQEDAARIDGSKFYQFSFIPRFNALFSGTTGTIFASCERINDTEFGIFPSRLAIRTLFESITGNETNLVKIPPEPAEGTPWIEIGRLSKTARLMLSAYNYAPIEIRLRNSGVKNHLEASQYLRTITDALFFTIEQESGVALRLSRPSLLGAFREDAGVEQPVDYDLPKVEYDREPLSLYWSGIGAESTPTIQYLFLYQCIEFYFPIYSGKKAQRSVRNYLMRPNFRIDRDSDLSRIIEIAKTATGRGVGTELEQLKAVLTECVTEDEVLEFAKRDENERLMSEPSSMLKAHKVGFSSRNEALMADVARRIYEIRCRIVHSKSSAETGEQAPILPFSEEEDKLQFDVRLIKMLAARVIASSGRPK